MRVCIDLVATPVVTSTSIYQSPMLVAAQVWQSVWTSLDVIRRGAFEQVVINRGNDSTELFGGLPKISMQKVFVTIPRVRVSLLFQRFEVLEHCLQQRLRLQHFEKDEPSRGRA